MLKRFTYLTLLMIFAILIGSCDNDDFMSPYDPSYSLPAPTNLVIEQIAVNQCRLTWQDNSLVEEGFKIEKKVDNGPFNEIGLVSANASTYTDIYSQVNSQIQYRVCSYYGQDDSAYEVGDVINNILSTPENLIINRIGISSIELGWTYNGVPGIEGFRIEKKVDNGTFNQIGLLSANTSTYTDTNAEVNSQLQYRVCSFSGVEDSAYEIGDVIDNDLPQVSNFLSEIVSNQIDLSWEYSLTGIDGFKLFKKVNNGDWGQAIMLDPDVRNYSDSEYNNYDAYNYKIQAFYQEIESVYVGTEIILILDGFVLVPAGTFTMGDTRGEGSSNELPTHQVTLSSFIIGKYEVTQAEYQAVMGTNPSQFSGSDKPVEQVTWNNAVEYCNARSIQEGLIPCYNTSTWACDFSANGYRLLTEAEWEYAARGATNNPDYLYAGSNDIASVAWYSGNSGNITHAVGSKAPNSLGIYDMSGNVWEWCNDWYGSYSSSAQSDPVGPATGSYRVIRGGSWYISAPSCRVAYRYLYSPTFSYYFIGFRLARSSN